MGGAAAGQCADLAPGVELMGLRLQLPGTMTFRLKNFSYDTAYEASDSLGVWGDSIYRTFTRAHAFFVPLCGAGSCVVSGDNACVL